MSAIAKVNVGVDAYAMHVTTAYDRREALSDSELARLQLALIDEVKRCEDAIRGYDVQKMQ